MDLSSDVSTAESSSTASLAVQEAPFAAEPAATSEGSAPEGRKPLQKRQLKPLDPVRILGQLLVWVGGLLVLFALFQLWGTGLLESRAQDQLNDEFAALLAEAAEADGAVAGVAEADVPEADVAEADVAEADVTEADAPEAAAGIEEPTPAEPDVAQPETAEPGPTLVPVGSDQLPAEGQAIARVTIESIGLNKTVVQGVQRDTLRDGPGHYPTSPMPGQIGNAAIAGHRTTHGAPFFNLDQVQPGDHIDVETLDGTFRYEVQAHTGPDGQTRGFFIVDPSDVSVISDQGDNRLTLTACHPKYSARQRIVVNALLIGEASPEPVVIAEPAAAPEPLPAEEVAAQDSAAEVEGGVTAAETGETGQSVNETGETPAAEQVDPGQTIVNDEDLLENSLGWQKQELDPTILWATVTLVVLHAGWVLGRVWRRRYAYVVAFPAAVVPLFICFIHLDRLLPAF